MIRKRLVPCVTITPKICHSLKTIQTTELAYQLAVANKIIMIPEWDKNGRAGIHLLHGFMNRNKELKILKKLYKKHSFAPNMKFR